MALNTTFLLLSSDYSKSLHLQSDRSLEFHTPQGCHYTTRLPRYGRDLIYDRQSTEALIPSAGVNPDGLGEVFRLNLELGRYMRSYEVDVGGDDFTSAGGGALQGGINTGAINTGAIAEESHNLLAFGTTIGTVELWDPRAKGRAGILLPPTQLSPSDERHEITALEFHRSGLTMGTGSSNGLVHLYDLRSPMPFLKKDQGYGFPIHTLKFLQPSSGSREQTMDPKILSSDKRIIKIWDPRDGSPWTSVEPAVDINSVAWCRDSGMILTANEGRQQHAFFIPQLGPAPRWCSFLDNIVEEMAEDPNDPQAFNAGRSGDVYDNYKFLTVSQLRTLNLDHLIGRTNLLRPYMHGYFVAQRLYEEARLITNPYIWEEERAKRVKDKIDKERESRIRGKKKVAVKVNKKLADKLLAVEEKSERRRAQKVLERGGDTNNNDNDNDNDNPNDTNTNTHIDATTTETEEPTTKKGLLGDKRFARLFEDEEFAVDENSREYKLLNPSSGPDQQSERKERGLTAVEQEAIDDAPNSDDDDDDDDDESSSSDESEKEEKRNQQRRAESKKNDKRKSNTKHQPQMQVSSSSAASVARLGQTPRDRSFASRAQLLHHREAKEKPSRRGRGGIVGEQEMTFTPASKKKKSAQSEEDGLGDHLSSSAATSSRAKERRSASGNAFRRM